MKVTLIATEKGSGCSWNRSRGRGGGAEGGDAARGGEREKSSRCGVRGVRVRTEPAHGRRLSGRRQGSETLKTQSYDRKKIMKKMKCWTYGVSQTYSYKRPVTLWYFGGKDGSAGTGSCSSSKQRGRLLRLRQASRLTTATATAGSQGATPTRCSRREGFVKNVRKRQKSSR